MSIVDRPIPNQPLFVWQINKTAISFRGHVQGKQGHHVSVFTKVIAGTQSGATIPVGTVVTGPSSIVRVYGYFLPAHWLLGATRYRVPMIVHIWNFMLNGMRIVVTVNSTVQETAVTAEASRDSGALSATYLVLGGIDVDHWMKAWFSVSNPVRSLYVIASSITNRTHKCLMGLEAVPSLQSKLAKLSVLGISKIVAEHLKMAVDTSGILIKKVMKLSVNIPAHLIEHVVKFVADLAGLDIQRSHKMSVHFRDGKIEHLTKLAVAICEKDIEAIAKLSFAIPDSVIEQMFKLSASLTPQEIVHVLSDLKFDVEAQWLEQRMVVKSDPTEETVKPLVIKSPVRGYMVETFWTKFTALTTTAVVTLRTHLTKYASALKDLLVHIPPANEVQQTIHCPFFFGDTDMELAVHMFNIVDHEENHYLEAQVINFIARTKLSFRPVALPWIHRAQCLITICNTSVQGYINFFLDEYKYQTGQVAVSTCQGFVRRLIQWYLMGGRVSNEGYGNEIIFDLGDVNPIGPIPPSPSLNWGGGYVEDPFLGAGYIPSEGTTGYASPEAEKWVQNVRMYWDSASTPFEEPEV